MEILPGRPAPKEPAEWYAGNAYRDVICKGDKQFRARLHRIRRPTLAALSSAVLVLSGCSGQPSKPHRACLHHPKIRAPARRQAQRRQRPIRESLKEEPPADSTHRRRNHPASHPARQRHDPRLHPAPAAHPAPHRLRGNREDQRPPSSAIDFRCSGRHRPPDRRRHLLRPVGQPRRLLQRLRLLPGTNQARPRRLRHRRTLGHERGSRDNNRSRREMNPVPTGAGSIAPEDSVPRSVAAK
jgi:hypothetical protein